MARKRSQRRRRAAPKARNHFVHALRRLKKLGSGDQCRAISMSNNKFIRQFCSHVKKMRHAKLSPQSRKALKKHKKQLQKLVSGKIGIDRKRQILSQRGGGILSTLLRAIPVIGPVLQNIL